ncbi:MAG: hypothetical protein ACLU3U_04830 [Gallintestinimicrobium sp.]
MKKEDGYVSALTAALTFGMLAGCGQIRFIDGGEKKELRRLC